MPQNFIGCDRDQAFLMPVDMRAWLPEDHLVWLVLDAVAEMDLAVFYGEYRDDGHGRAAYDPSMMVALLLYAYARGERSSRGIERECLEDIAYRVIAANQRPDHATIARFVQRHEDALAGVFGGVLAVCARAGAFCGARSAITRHSTRTSSRGSSASRLLTQPSPPRCPSPLALATTARTTAAETDPRSGRPMTGRQCAGGRRAPVSVRVRRPFARSDC